MFRIVFAGLRNGKIIAEIGENDVHDLSFENCTIREAGQLTFTMNARDYTQIVPPVYAGEGTWGLKSDDTSVKSFSLMIAIFNDTEYYARWVGYVYGTKVNLRDDTVTVSAEELIKLTEYAPLVEYSFFQPNRWLDMEAISNVRFTANSPANLVRLMIARNRIFKYDHTGGGSTLNHDVNRHTFWTMRETIEDYLNRVNDVTVNNGFIVAWRADTNTLATGFTTDSNIWGLLPDGVPEFSVSDSRVVEAVSELDYSYISYADASGTWKPEKNSGQGSNQDNQYVYAVSPERDTSAWRSRPWYAKNLGYSAPTFNIAYDMARHTISAGTRALCPTSVSFTVVRECFLSVGTEIKFFLIIGGVPCVVRGYVSRCRYDDGVYRVVSNPAFVTHVDDSKYYLPTAVSDIGYAEQDGAFAELVVSNATGIRRINRPSR